jgi:hypothetical protein
VPEAGEISSACARFEDIRRLRHVVGSIQQMRATLLVRRQQRFRKRRVEQYGRAFFTRSRTFDYSC